jgi:hypothetical protein
MGYIYAMRDELFLKDDNTVNLVWFVKIPATGERYSIFVLVGTRLFAVQDGR